MLKAAIRDDNPVVMMEAEMMYGWEDEVPQEEYLVELGKANIKRPGDAVTIITFGKVLRAVLTASAELEKAGISAEVIDLRTLRPLDESTITVSVNRTQRCVVVDESWPIASVGSHVGWLISNRCFDRLDGQVELVSMEDVPMPYNHRLELAVGCAVDKIISAAKKVLYL